MTDTQKELRLKLLKDQLTIAVWFENDFKKRLGGRGYQDFIDSILDEIIILRAIKKDSESEV